MSVLAATAHTLCDPAGLIKAAVEELIKANIDNAAFRTLEHLVGNVCMRVHGHGHRFGILFISAPGAAADPLSQGTP